MSEDQGNTAPPVLEKPRWWSNPGLNDPQTIIALVLSDPSTVDLARIMAHYGIETVDEVRRRTEMERDAFGNRFLETIYAPVVEGVRDALQRSS